MILLSRRTNRSTMHAQGKEEVGAAGLVRDGLPVRHSPGLFAFRVSSMLLFVRRWMRLVDRC